MKVKRSHLFRIRLRWILRLSALLAISSSAHLLFFFISTSAAFPPPPPLPVLPIPSSAQLQWQLGEMAIFLHFGTNTFTDSEWGTGHADPTIFYPAGLNASQWAQVAAAAGFSRIILTVKHHDGFCLWQTQYTNYSVAASPWKDGNGDVLAEAAAAARAAGIGLGVYLSPWDRHEASYGDTFKYNEFYMGQMTELLTGYGEIKEVWLDGAKGKGEKNMDYFFESWFKLIRQLQPQVTIFSDAGPDTRWVGDESGSAGSTSWSPFNRSAVTIGGDNDLQYSLRGDPDGHDWVPPECDVSIRPGWFWHRSEHPKFATTLLDLYYNSVGRNCLLLLNVPPNSSGLISAEDMQVLQEFSELRKIIFSTNFAKNATVTASSTRGGTAVSRFSSSNVLQDGIYSYWAPEEGQSYWELYLDFQKSVTFNVLQVQEPIQMGQRVFEFHLDILSEGIWRTVINGTTVGYKRLLRITKVVESQFVRLVIDKSRADPLISYFGIFLDPFTITEKYPSKKSFPCSTINGSEANQLKLNSYSVNKSHNLM